MISVEQALARICDSITPLPAEMVGLSEGLGRVLAGDLASRRTHPPVAVSAMDGYAVRAQDAGVAPARPAALPVGITGICERSSTSFLRADHAPSRNNPLREQVFMRRRACVSSSLWPSRPTASFATVEEP